MAQSRVKRLDAAGLLDYALRSLGARAHSTGEMKEKLRRRAERLSDIDGVLARLKDLGYLNDRKFADLVAGVRLANRGLGRARVLRELRTRRVAPTVAEQAVTAAYREVDETALIESFIERKFRKIDLASHLAEPRNLASAYRKLRHAGFSSGNSIRVLKRYASQAEELESMDETAGDPTA